MTRRKKKMRKNKISSNCSLGRGIKEVNRERKGEGWKSVKHKIINKYY